MSSLWVGSVPEAHDTAALLRDLAAVGIRPVEVKHRPRLQQVLLYIHHHCSRVTRGHIQLSISDLFPADSFTESDVIDTWIGFIVAPSVWPMVTVTHSNIH